MFFKSHTNKSFLIQLITVECTPRMVLIRTFLSTFIADVSVVMFLSAMFTLPLFFYVPAKKCHLEINIFNQ